MSLRQKHGFKDVEEFFERSGETAKKLDKEIPQEKEMEIPVFVPKDVSKEQPKDEAIKVEKNNLANIVIDDVTGETIPPISREKVTVDIPLADKNSNMYEEHHVPIEEPAKKLEPKYDYNEPYSFKEVRDGGKF
jgi:ferredoxin-fold anticodon binding domain-containing protein